MERLEEKCRWRLPKETDGVENNAIWETDKDTKDGGKQESLPDQVTNGVKNGCSKDILKIAKVKKT